MFYTNLPCIYYKGLNSSLGKKIIQKQISASFVANPIRLFSTDKSINVNKHRINTIHFNRNRNNLINNNKNNIPTKIPKSFFSTSSTKFKDDSYNNIHTSKTKIISNENNNDNNIEIRSNIEKVTKSRKQSWKERYLGISADESDKATFTEVIRLIKLARRDLPLFSLAMLLLIFTAAIVLAIPKVTGLILDSTKNFNDLEDIKLFGLSLDNFLISLGILLILATVATFGRLILMRIIGENLVSRLRSRFMKKIFLQDMSFYDKNKVGDLISRLSSDAYVVSKSITQNMSDGIKHTIVLSSSLTMMFLLSYKLSLILLAFVPPLVFISYIYGLKAKSISRNLQQATGALTKVSEQQLNSIKTIQSFTAEVKELHNYNDKIRNVWKVSFKDAATHALFIASTNTLSHITFLLTLGLGTRDVLNGVMTIGDLTAYLIYIEYCGNATYGLSSFYTELFKGAGAASRLFEMLDIKPLIDPVHGHKLVSKANCSKLPVDGKEIICKGHIQFDNVGFTYPTRPKNIIFKNLSFSIPMGSSVCIVGPSGRGKSTIASLLLRFYKPDSGKILIDGYNIEEFSIHSVRQTFGFVQQEPVLIEGTIEENIKYGLPLNMAKKITKSDIEWAAQKANCDFIYTLPDEFDTNIGPRGSLLSGGQRQKIALARCLIKEPPVLILDEATSALDGKSEAAINETLDRLMKVGNMTTISIAHRLSTIERCENILVLGYDGTIVEEGKFRDLWADKNSKLWKLLNTKQDKKQKEEDETKEEQEENKAENNQEEQNADIDTKLDKKDAKKVVIQDKVEAEVEMEDIKMVKKERAGIHINV